MIVLEDRKGVMRCLQGRAIFFEGNLSLGKRLNLFCLFLVQSSPDFRESRQVRCRRHTHVPTRGVKGPARTSTSGGTIANFN
jgi:hypothetical protein